MPYEPHSAKLVLVEGREEVGLFEALCKHLGLDGIELIDYGGKNRLPAFLKALVLGPRFRKLVTTLAITRDADDNARNAFRSVVGAAKHAGLHPPLEPGKVGRERPKIHVLILPDGTKPGMLEDVCMESVREHAAMPCVDGLFECLQEVGEPLPGNMSKARVYAYLATRPEPGRRIGETAGSGTWPFDSSAFKPIRELMLSL